MTVSNGRDVAIHGIDGLENDNFRGVPLIFLKEAFEMLQVVVPLDPLRAAALAHALDHRGVVLLIREDNRALQKLHQR